ETLIHGDSRGAQRLHQNANYRLDTATYRANGRRCAAHTRDNGILQHRRWMPEHPAVTAPSIAAME
ncbi:MAG: hypothetical protein ACHQ4H_08715, partial [Ktedonobacterales bacterium]